ncbi:hypothetical protein PCH_Pc12g16120 [Penicillium rubens Wisconsin 54-1255]|uniref:Uncharacterized protein n=1 Tax=Penicillium rubens (strain ATCC 28089 / DSM 1075 / NRRL 1951 / Wisconsin 54-1255) TaxID=500485 RepID=B6GYP2_PENRW|nr:hypothetical protein PCH_Pc12g16120 [Penicillium rubens Wisconsin 54-1255]
MDRSSNAMYIAALERHITFLQHTWQERRPHVPEAIVRKSQHLQKVPSLALPFHPTSHTSVEQRGITPQPKPPNIEARWKVQLQKFIGKIPTAPEWTKKVPAPDSSVLGVLFQNNAIAAQPCSAAPTECLNIIQTDQQCALFTGTRIRNAANSRLFAPYSKIIFCALCHVACCNGVAPKEVDQAITTISKGSSTHLEQLRHGVTWAIEAIDCLHREGWGIRSGDILVHYFTEMAASDAVLSRQSAKFHAMHLDIQPRPPIPS